jgi:hypothetical protein
MGKLAPGRRGGLGVVKRGFGWRMEIKGMMLPLGHILQTKKRSQRETDGICRATGELGCVAGSVYRTYRLCHVVWPPKAEFGIGKGMSNGDSDAVRSTKKPLEFSTVVHRRTCRVTSTENYVNDFADIFPKNPFSTENHLCCLPKSLPAMN